MKFRVICTLKLCLLQKYKYLRFVKTSGRQEKEVKTLIKAHENHLIKSKQFIFKF